MYLPYLLAHLILLALPCLLLLSASPSPSPEPYPAVVSLPSRPLLQSASNNRGRQTYQQAAQLAAPEVDHDLLPFVLISTIDGALHAVERDGGKIRWTLRDGVEPLVGGGIRGKGQDEYIVEPLSGSLYVFEGDEGDSPNVRKLPLSVEQLIELSPFTFPHSPTRIFTGSKHTSLLTVDLRTGQQLDCFSSLASNFSDPDSCVCENDQLLDDMDGRARSNADLLFVGRTDYRLTIHSPPSSSTSLSTSDPSSSETDDNRRSSVQEITYSTYTPNSFDKPLAEFWAKVGSSQKQWADDGTESKSMRVELGHDGVAVGVETGGGVRWITKLGSIGIGVYDILLPLSPAATAKPILVPQPPPHLESLFPLPSNPDQQHYDIHKKPPTTYIGSVPYQLALPGTDNDSSNPPVPPKSPQQQRPLLYALSSASYPLINFAPPARPGVLANGSFPLSEDLPEKDQLLPYLLDPAVETDKTIDPAPPAGLLDGLSRRRGRGRGWIFWVIGVVGALAAAGLAIAGLDRRRRSTVKQTATPPNEKEPLMEQRNEEGMDRALSRDVPNPVDSQRSTTPSPLVEPAGPVTPNAAPVSLPPGAETTPKQEEVKPKKKNARRRVRGRKKRSNSNAALMERDSNEDDEEQDGQSATPGKEEKPLPDLPREMSTTALHDIHDKERLVISDNIIGYGSSGTVVLKGEWGGRPVAVKRLLADFTRLASQEARLLQASDDHPNVIRYYCQERRDNFLYIALDLCPASLADLIATPSQHMELAASLDRKKALVQVTAGLRHLHGMKIIHRDIKPQNVLVSRGKDGSLRMLVSDFGLARRLDQDQSSFAPTANNLAGTLGWRAPECIRGQVALSEGIEWGSTLSSSSSSGTLLELGAEGAEGEEARRANGHARLTKAVDLFALGCLYFWVLMSGQHPFGERYNRESNIVKGDIVNMGSLEILGEEGVEAQELIGRLLSNDPALRPETAECTTHPFFWTPAKRLAFLCDASDRFEIMELDPPEPPLIALETDAVNVVGKDWCSRLDKTFTSSLGKYRKYKGNSVRDLLRAMRNKKHHYQDLDAAAKRHLGSLPAGFLTYFTSRYPRLFLHVYGTVKESRLRHESMFEMYFSGLDE